MKFFKSDKDGGPDSTVTGYWLIEIKSLFSIVLLRFDHGSREEYHSHAFNCVSWLLYGKLKEQVFGRTDARDYLPSIVPIVTKRSTFHRVYSWGTSWVLTFRGPWTKQWSEYDPRDMSFKVLGHGRVVRSRSK